MVLRSFVPPDGMSGKTEMCVCQMMAQPSARQIVSALHRLSAGLNVRPMFKKPERSKESGLRSRLELLGSSADSANGRDSINGDQAVKPSKISVALDDADDATEETSNLSQGALISSKIMCTN